MGRRHKINVAKAKELRSTGLGWKEIGAILATGRNRDVVFLAASVSQAVSKSKKMDQYRWYQVQP